MLPIRRCTKCRAHVWMRSLGYGFTAFRGRGLLTPYARLSLAHDAARGYRLGSRLALGPSASVSIEAQRREYPAVPINHALLVLGTLQF